MATISCNPGYETKTKDEPGVTEITLECRQIGAQTEATADWTSELPVCQPKNCSTLPDIQQGSIFYEPSTLYGSKATYICKGEYKIQDGDAVRFCGTNSKWNGTEPKCKLVSCGKPRILPGHLQFEFINSTGSIFDDIAFYRCGKPKTPQEFRCESDGQWKPTGKLIPCVDVDCGRPTDPAFGYHKRLSRDYEFGSKVNFHCYFGYKLSSDAVISCGSSGKWQPSPPNCTAMSCSKLPDMTSGTIEVTGTQVNDTANYKCNKGYKLLGPNNRICLVHQKSGATFWTSSPPKCYSERCPDYSLQNESGSDGKTAEMSSSKDKKCRKCCKMMTKKTSQICARNQYVIVAKIINVTNSAPGSAEYKIEMTNLIKGKDNLIRGAFLKIIQNYEECSSVECSPLKKNQKYFIGGQKYKSRRFILRWSDNFYVEMVEKSKFKMKRSRLVKHCSKRK